MAVITIFSASYCQGEDIARQVAQALGYKYKGDEFLQQASERYSVPKEKLEDIMHGRSSFLEKLTGDKRAKIIPCIKAAFTGEVKEDNIVYHGFAGHLLPKDINHVLKVCLVADRDYRIKGAIAKEGISEKEAAQKINNDDRERLQWTEHLFELGPWDSSLYDIVIPMHERSLEKAVGMITENARKETLLTTAQSARAMEDYLLATQVHVALLDIGHDIEVSSSDGNIIIAILKFTWWLESLKEKLEKKAAKIPGVKSVHAKEGPDYHLRRQEHPSPEHRKPAQVQPLH